LIKEQNLEARRQKFYDEYRITRIDKRVEYRSKKAEVRNSIINPE